MVVTTRFIQDIVLFVRNLLRTNLTDPITRSGNEQFIVTAYPKRPVNYPIITVKQINLRSPRRSGMQSELRWTEIELEVRIWARNEIERDKLTQDTFNVLRNNEFGSGSSNDESLHDLQINSGVNVDESGVQGNKSKVFTISYKFTVGV